MALTIGNSEISRFCPVSTKWLKLVYAFILVLTFGYAIVDVYSEIKIKTKGMIC